MAAAADELRELAGTDQIPVLQTEDGRIFRGTREIFAHLEEREPWRYAAAHRRRFEDHRDARESDAAGQLLEHFKGSGGLESAEPRATPDDATVVNVPQAHRYELLLDGRRIGLLAYRGRNGRIALTHTEVSPSCEGRGFGSRLAATALDDARRKGLSSCPSARSSPGTSSATPSTAICRPGAPTGSRRRVATSAPFDARWSSTSDEGFGRRSGSLRVMSIARRMPAVRGSVRQAKQVKARARSLLVLITELAQLG